MTLDIPGLHLLCNITGIWHAKPVTRNTKHKTNMVMVIILPGNTKLMPNRGKV